MTAGTSIQGNPITGIHIYGSSGKGVKPAVLFHGTVHAREWITTLVSQQSKFQQCGSTNIYRLLNTWRTIFSQIMPATRRSKDLLTNMTIIFSQL